MRKFIRYFFIGLLIFFVLIQFYPRPSKNLSDTISNDDITRVAVVNDSVKAILEKSCYDCHSNNTTYPWYFNIQPFGWWLGRHIEEGKKELNFSIFGSYTEKRKKRKFDEIIEQIESKEMPLKSYSLIHRESRLNDEDRAQITRWAKQNEAIITIQQQH